MNHASRVGIVLLILLAVLVAGGRAAAEDPAGPAEKPKADIAMDSLERLTLNGAFVATPEKLIEGLKKLGVKRGTTLVVRVHAAADFGALQMLAGPLAYAGYGVHAKPEPAKPGVVKLMAPGKLPVKTLQTVLAYAIGHCGGGRLATSMASPTRKVLVVRADAVTLKVVESLIASIGAAIDKEPAVRLLILSSGAVRVEGQDVESDELLEEVADAAGKEKGPILAFILGKQARPAAAKTIAKLAKAGHAVKSVLIDELGPGQDFPEFKRDAPKVEIKPAGLPLRELSEILRGVFRTAIRTTSHPKKKLLEVQGDRDTLVVVQRIAAELAATPQGP